MEQKQLRPLSSVGPGQTVRLARIDAGQALRSRLTAMGLVPNVQITVVSSGQPGPLMVSVKSSRIMLGRGMAQKIMVL